MRLYQLMLETRQLARAMLVISETSDRLRSPAVRLSTKQIEENVCEFIQDEKSAIHAFVYRGKKIEPKLQNEEIECGGGEIE